jgi:hypothetical protein
MVRLEEGGELGTGGALPGAGPGFRIMASIEQIYTSQQPHPVELFVFVCSVPSVFVFLPPLLKYQQFTVSFCIV